MYESRPGMRACLVLLFLKNSILWHVAPCQLRRHRTAARRVVCAAGPLRARARPHASPRAQQHVPLGTTAEPLAPERRAVRLVPGSASRTRLHLASAFTSMYHGPFHPLSDVPVSCPNHRNPSLAFWVVIFLRSGSDRTRGDGASELALSFPKTTVNSSIAYSTLVVWHGTR